MNNEIEVNSKTEFKRVTTLMQGRIEELKAQLARLEAEKIKEPEKFVTPPYFFVLEKQAKDAEERLAQAREEHTVLAEHFIRRGDENINLKSQLSRAEKVITLALHILNEEESEIAMEAAQNYFKEKGEW